MSDKNLILLILDNFRFDSFDNENLTKKLFPNLFFLKTNGFFSQIISNGHATKFVMPSLFSQTYPLDYGGYNQVLKKRPMSFVELLKKKGYTTYMLQGDDNDGPENMCERGFDYIEAIYDRRLLLQNFLQEVFQYEIKRTKKFTTKKSHLIELLKPFKNILMHIAQSKNRVERQNLPDQLKKLSKRDSLNFTKEIDLLKKHPQIIINKIERVEPYLYYLVVGKTNFDSLYFKIKKKFIGLLSFCEQISIKIISLKILTFRKTPFADEILYSCKSIIKNKLFFIYAHLMDIHDRKVINRPIRFFKRLSLWPKWVLISKDKSFKRFLYDSSLNFIDKEIGNLMHELKKKKKFSQTKFIITGDHGCELYDNILRGNIEDFSFRNHREHINVPLIYFNADKKIKNVGLHDSMSIAASILDDLNIKKHNSFKGRSVFKNGKKEIITENADRGNCDIENKNLFFSVTCESYKAMFCLKKDKLFVERFYDLKADKNEINNLVFKEQYRKIIIKKVKYLFKERSKIMKKRKIIIKNVYIKNIKFFD